MISVCIATYNGERYIREQLDSILSQLSANDEVVISDDGSNDRTLEIVESFCDNRIRIIHNKGDHGYTSNFENALRHSKGNLIILSDQDDVWMPDKVDKIKYYLGDYDYIVTDAMIVDENLECISESFWSIRKPYFSAMGDWIKGAYLGCCMAFKREILELALPFPKNHKLCTHDYWLQLVGTFFFSVKYLNESLVLYRRHGENVSNGGLGKGLSLSKKIKYRVYTLYWLFLRRIRCKRSKLTL